MANGLIWIPKRLVELGLLNVAAQLPQKFVEYCEQDYAARVQQAAVQVRQSGARVVMLTGPSSSGKTTTAHKLAASLRGAGVESAVVSLDNFFKNVQDYPRLPDGRPDYESVDALDIPAILRALASLIETGRAEIPDFDFNREQRVCGTLEVSVGRGVAVVDREGVRYRVPNRLTEEEVRQYAAKAIQTGNIAKCAVRPTQTDLEEMYRESLG